MVGVRFLLLILGTLITLRPAAAHPIEAGVAVTDAEAMAYLEKHGFALSALFSQNWTYGATTPVLNNALLSGTPPLAAIAEVVRTEFREYRASYLDRFPEVGERNIGPGTTRNHRLFERNYLDSKDARFELVGIVNRMDRAFRSPETCGEVRLIYRLAYQRSLSGLKFDAARQKFVPSGTVLTNSRMPMTINLVLKARPAPEPNEPPVISCAAIAKRWLAAGALKLEGEHLAKALMSQDSVLALITPQLIDRMETNIQVIRVPSTVVPSFGGNAEYLLHIFKWNAGTGTLTMWPLENQIDRIELLRNPQKLANFKNWLFRPEQLHALAEGTITIPEEYLAKRAITSAPGGTARATNRPFLGLVSNAEATSFFSRFKDAAAKLDPEGKLRNIDSPFGLMQRLTDITCTGCHQSRAIGGFHFLGADRTASIKALPQNSIFIAGSPHFYGDLPRRRAVVEAFAAEGSVDFGRGFSMRPRVTGRGGVTVFPAKYNTIRKGWGANCYTNNGPSGDASFRDWTCADGLVCKPLHESEWEPGLGICLTKAQTTTQLKIGDPFLFGRMTATKIFKTGQPGVYQYRDEYHHTVDLKNCKTVGTNRSLPNCTPEPLPRGATRCGRCGTGKQCCRVGTTPNFTWACRPADPNAESLRTPGDARNCPADSSAAYQAGGFFGGMHKSKFCNTNPANTICGTEAGAHFSKCISALGSGGASFVPCLSLKETSDPATLRKCSVDTPCRDDYVCLATKSTLATGFGACLPPYFLFQFRIDGHPIPLEGPADPSTATVIYEDPSGLVETP